MMAMRWQRPKGFLSLYHAPNHLLNYPSHGSSKPTSNPPEPLVLWGMPKGDPHFPNTGEGRQEKEVSSSQGQKGHHQGRAISICQALG